MKNTAYFIITVILLASCSSDSPSGPGADNFDRQAVLVNWADNIIIPAFDNMSSRSSGLRAEAEAFVQDPTALQLSDLRNAWQEAYLAFQHVSMFEMGKAMELRYRDNMNIYPTDISEIEDNITSGSWNLELPSLNDSQGFPALDYMINGIADSEQEIVELYLNSSEAASYRNYLLDLSERIETLTNTVRDHWTTGYRDEFVNNSGNGANASMDMMVNDYIFYYERNLRAGKIGIPAGVFSGSPLSTHTEAFYSDGLSKTLFLEALEASQNFYNGVHFNSTERGESLSTYIQYLQSLKGSADLATLIDDQFDAAETVASELSSDLSEQVESDNSVMLRTYDELQANVVYLKVDMLQALNINVDYVDADGD